MLVRKLNPIIAMIKTQNIMNIQPKKSDVILVDLGSPSTDANRRTSTGIAINPITKIPKGRPVPALPVTASDSTIIPTFAR
jgi:hypothetical protein